MKIELQRVHYIPNELKPGVLYVAEKFGAAAHLCPCGCGSKIRTPLGPTEWRLEETRKGPTLNPSIGNWQKPCQSHYWITAGEIIWADKWEPQEIEAGRRSEQVRRDAYYQRRARKGRLRKLWSALKRVIKR